jgi:hypothetical protein
MKDVFEKMDVLGSEMDELLGGKSITVKYTTTDKDGKTTTVTVTYEV